MVLPIIKRNRPRCFPLSTKAEEQVLCSPVAEPLSQTETRCHQRSFLFVFSMAAKNADVDVADARSRDRLLNQTLKRSSTRSFSESSDEEDGEFRPKLRLLRERTDGLVEATESFAWQSSPVAQACRVSVRTRMREVLRQAAGFVSSLEACSDPPKSTIYRLRCSIALLRAEKYLNLIESGLKNPPRDELDRRLREVLESDALETVRNDLGQNFFFQISPWVSSFLAFDLPAGRMAETVVNDLPLVVQVEPMLEFNSEDLLEQRDVLSQVKSCSVSILKCKHKSRSFSGGAGTIGECLLQVRLAPSGEPQDRSTRVWGQHPDEPTLCIREARA